MHAIEHTYIGLLADVAQFTGFSEIRGSYEGLQWCLHEAPKLEKYTLRCVESGEQPDPSRYPVWLRRLALGSMNDPMLMRYLRQLLLFCYKAQVQHDNETTQAAFSSFIATNRSVNEVSNGLAKASPRLLNAARKHCQSVLYRFRAKALQPSHGPGASYTPKSVWTHWYSSIEYVYPYSDWFTLYFNREHLSELGETPIDAHIESKLIAVPKDSRGPRLICVHPAESIWIQQGLRVELERAISLHRRANGPWPKGHIHFDDQSVNGKIALLSSSSRRYATLDMKEASDRISETLVQILFGSHYKYFGCCRAQKYRIPKLSPEGDFVDDIHSYAPMGNATTFPVQSLVFWAICCASLQSHGCNSPGAAFVFGDDIIVPSKYALGVMNDLESFGLVVNKEKSFWRGAFRESCGVDAFNGVNVTPVRWKTTLDAEHLSGELALSDIALRLRLGGYEEAANVAYAVLGQRVYRKYHCKLPVTNNRKHGGIAEYVNCDSKVWSRAIWHKDKQWYHTRILRVEEVNHRANLDRWNDVLNSIVSLDRKVNPYGLKHMEHMSLLDRSAPRRLRLKRGWTPVV